MERHYFIGEGPEAKELITKTWARLNVCNNARDKLLKQYEADNVVTSKSNITGGGRVVALWFKEPVQRPYLKGGERLEGGNFYYPNRRTKEGKELARRLKEDEALTFDYSTFILKTLGISRIVFDEALTMHYCTAGFADGKVLLSVPGPKFPKDLEERKKLGLSIDPWPVIPDWLREVKESEFLAVQGK